MLAHSCVCVKLFSAFRGDDTENGGELILGGIDHSLYKGSIHWVPVTEKSYWQIHINKYVCIKNLVEFTSLGKPPETETPGDTGAGRLSCSVLPQCPSERGSSG